MTTQKNYKTEIGPTFIIYHKKFNKRNDMTKGQCFKAVQCFHKCDMQFQIEKHIPYYY